MKRIIIIILLGMIISPVSAQDSLKLFSIQQLFEIIKKFHPVARQANIQVEKALADQMLAKGGFDPVLNLVTDSKTFDGINYYNQQSTTLTVPTWYGIELQTGIEFLEGSRTNPPATAGKTNFTQVSVPLAKNLLMDKRRAALLVSRQMVQLSIQEKNGLLNDLLKEAAEAYWNWQQAWHNFQTYTVILAVNEKRMGMVKTAFQQGDRPAIDSTEAQAQLQNIQYLKNEAFLSLQNARLALDIFLWKENDKPYDLPEESRPEQSLESLLEQVVIFDEEKLFEDSRLNHPELKQYDNKLKIMKVNKRLKFQDLLPKLDLKYTIPGKGFDIVNTGYKNLFSAANQKFGISFSLPLRLREGRGAYKAASLKLEETRLQFEQKKMMVRNKLQRTFNQLTNYKIQLELLKKMYGNYATLQRAEELRFLNGESSVFLVNTRENKTLETRLKLTETAIGYSKMRYKLLWDAGILWRN